MQTLKYISTSKDYFKGWRKKQTNKWALSVSSSSSTVSHSSISVLISSATAVSNYWQVEMDKWLAKIKKEKKKKNAKKRGRIT